MANITKVVPEVAPTYVLELTEAELIYLKIVLGSISPTTDEAIIGSSTIPTKFAQSIPNSRTAQDVWNVVQREVHGVYNNVQLVVREK